MHEALKGLKQIFGISAATGLRYAFFAGLAWLLGYVFYKKVWKHRKIIPRDPEAAHVWREVAYSALTLVVFGGVGALTHQFVKSGYGRMYFDFHQHGWGWFIASVVLAIGIHDTYFYWTHRFMHHRLLFKLFHGVHHKSTNPTPWAAYCFAPLEAVVQAGIFPVLAFSIPIHPLGMLVFMTWQITFNVIGHTGYEFYPCWMMDTFLGKFLNTPTNHVMHHEYIRGNFGLYFNVWDRLMGTNHENYEARFREVTSRAKARPAAEPVYSSEPLSAE